jgi:hypothetical protein
MVTNSEWAVPASGDERRYFVLDVGNRRRQDHGYFAAIHEQLDRNGREGLRALLTLLLKFPAGHYNLRRVPETGALRAQRTLSLEPHSQFIFDALVSGEVAGVEWYYNAYIDAAKKRGKSHLMPPSQFARRFIEATGAAPARPRINGGRVCSWQLPALADAAAKFARVHKVDVPVTTVADGSDYPF